MVAKDYDRWAQKGCLGWSYDDLVPYFRRSERYEAARDPENAGESLNSTLNPAANSNTVNTDAGWRTPLLSTHYAPVIPTPGWRTPPTSNYVP